MEQGKIEMFVMQHNKQFSAADMMLVRQRLEQLSDDAFLQISSIQFKTPTTTLLLAWLGGAFGIDGFYLGKIGFGVTKLLVYLVYMVCYIVGIVSEDDSMILIAGIPGLVMIVLLIVGIVNATKWTRQYNFRKFTEATQAL